MTANDKDLIERLLMAAAAARMVDFGCHVCGKHPRDGHSTFRQNEKGVPGIFACDEHDKRRDSITHDAVAKIEARDPGRSKH